MCVRDWRFIDWRDRCHCWRTNQSDNLSRAEELIGHIVKMFTRINVTLFRNYLELVGGERSEERCKTGPG
jgi:hypothetical protein